MIYSIKRKVECMANEATPTSEAGVVKRRGNTRDRMVRTAAELLGEYGVAGTSIDRVLSVSGAPRGSVYYHFPGGRVEMLSAAVEQAGELVMRTIRESPDPSAALRTFADFWRARLEATGFRAGCPVLAVTVDENPELPELHSQAAAAFAGWQDALAARLVESGLDDGAAATLAEQSLCLLEGAVAMCRARREIAPLDSAVEAIGALYRLRERG